MALDLRRCRGKVLARLRAAPELFCFLDYDGTLAPIAPSPAEARPLPGTADVLRRLSRAPRTGVAVISGRPIDDLRRQLRVGGIHYIGIHGLERQWPDGRREVVPATAAARIPEIHRLLQRKIGGRAGILLEDKGVAIACHYRLASRADARAAREAVVALVESYRQRGMPLTFIDGHQVTEIRPAGTDKGTAVCDLLSSFSPSPLALYIGDDRTDEDAFRRLPPTAITIRVGPAKQKTLARYRLPGPVEVQAFLIALLAARASATG